MTYETPAARWLREHKEAEAAAAAEGRYEETLLAKMFKRGEVTYDEVLALFRDGKVYRRPAPYPEDTNNWDEIEANTYGDPFWGLSLPPDAKLTEDEFLAIKLARSGYIDDNDPRNEDGRLASTLPPPPESVSGKQVRFCSETRDHSDPVLLMSADGRLFVLQKKPFLWSALPDTWDVDRGIATGALTALDADQIARIESLEMKNPTRAALWRLRELLAPESGNAVDGAAVDGDGADGDGEE